MPFSRVYCLYLLLQFSRSERSDAARVQSESTALSLYEEEENAKATATGPRFTQSLYPPFIESLTKSRLNGSEGSDPVPASCGTSFEATLKVDRALHNAMKSAFNTYFQSVFIFEGEKEKCGSDYTSSKDSPEECRRKCAMDDKCTAYVVLIDAQAKDYCGPCLMYHKNSCEKQFRKSTSCKGSFIGAYSKAKDFVAGPALGMGLLEERKDGSRFGLQEGHKLIRIDDKPMGAFFSDDRQGSRNKLWLTIGEALKTKDEITLGFEAGVDFRSCWGSLTDLAGDAVCGDDAMGKLLTSIGDPGNAPSQDTAGQSGSTLIPNYDNFIIKNIMDDTEFQLLRDSLPKFQRNIRDRPGNCFSSSLAPICAVMVEGRNAKWMLMRKIELPKSVGGSRLGFPNDKGGHHHLIKWIDIKGPYFAQNFMDGKSQFAAWGLFTPDGDKENEGWKHKDPGFVKMFPEGLRLKHVGSRDAGATLSFDTLMLTEESMTDYSLFAQFYEGPLNQDSASVLSCGAGGAAKFPMILEIEPFHIPAREASGKSFIMVIGIIDYIERRVNRDAIGARFSTMKESWEYREIFMRMWPDYFKIPDMQCASDSQQEGTLVAEHGMPGERLTVGMRVMAIEELKWKSSSRELQRGVKYKYYYEQLIMKASATNRTSGSKYKVLPGAMGTLVAFVVPGQDQKANRKEASMLGRSEATIVIKWDPDTGVGKKVIKPSSDGTEKVFSVSADQVMAWSELGGAKTRQYA